MNLLQSWLIWIGILSTFTLSAQSYSSVTDEEVYRFIKTVRKKNLDAHILNWERCDLIYEEEICYKGDYIKQADDTLITQEDIFHFRSQYQFVVDKGASLFSIFKKRNPNRPHSNISVPLFSQDRKLAIVKVSYWCGDECGSGGIMIFRKTGKKWKFVEERCTWIS